MTPFEAAGYTKDTVFRVVKAAPRFPVGTQVKLWRDDGTDIPFSPMGRLRVSSSYTISNTSPDRGTSQ